MKKLQVKTDYVPDGGDYITKGKWYDVYGLEGRAGHSVGYIGGDDIEELDIFIVINAPCAHLHGSAWETRWVDVE